METVIGRIHGAIVAATGRSDHRGDDRRVPYDGTQLGVYFGEGHAGISVGYTATVRSFMMKY